MNASKALRITAAVGFLFVALGAFGAHGMEARLEALGTADVWETAVFYHAIHTVMMFCLCWREGRFAARGPWWAFLIGTVVFSGTLYVLAATGVKWLGAITPLGGVSFLVGWIWLAVSAGATGKGEISS